ncbi:hypothetical protein [Novosphingobium olei]|uniref:hypothetical protein n=1 Tax=Novosphingobium olei TaxID=2728851 RepID=UPI00197FB5DC|nr:hypothetical protein [Novosphingobium olei]
MRHGLVLALAFAATPAFAQNQAMDHGAMDHGAMDHGAMNHGAMPGMDMATPAAPAEQTDHAAMDHASMDHMDMGGMVGALGGYSMMRDASGTSWQPDSAPMMAIMGRLGGWATMVHGNLTVVQDWQGGPRGDDKAFAASMLMGMAQHPLGGGTLTLRAMGSLDPLMGKRGYPLLLATGETADGRTELVDRQHPHDAFMELAASYSHPLGDRVSGFVYFGLPGEPALGPTTFMHRFSGMANPEAPISHHWLDSTHVTFGVATAGIVAGNVKLEGSLFTGREPDQNRWDIERPRFDSWSARASWNPTANLSLQVSHGFLKSPEGLHPDEDVHRTTASATWNLPLGQRRNLQTTLAWGRNAPTGGDHHAHATNAFLLESALQWGRWTVFGRGENGDKGELFDSGPLEGRVFNVSKLSLGGYHSVPIGKVALDFGGLVSAIGLPATLKPVYGGEPISGMIFTRLRITG